MVAGATGIDLFLLVVDADEGARPQTLEHLAILRLLGIERGVVALTKTDLVDDEPLELARAEAEELVPGAPVVAVSARTGAGLDELLAALAVAGRPSAYAPTRRRASTSTASSPCPGIGTVVTGTLWSGSVGDGDELPSSRAAAACACAASRCTTEPSSGRRPASASPSRCRASSAGASAGDALVAPGAYRSSYRLDVALEPPAEIPPRVHGPPRNRGRAGTRRAGRRAASRSSACRSRSSRRAATASSSGGHDGRRRRVLDPAPPRHASLERMELLERGDAAATIYEPVREESLAHLGELAGVERAGGWVFSSAWLETLRAELSAQLDAADPLDPGVAAARGALGGCRRAAPRPRAARREALPPGRSGSARRAHGGGGRTGSRARARAGEARRRRARTLPRRQGRLVRVGDGYAVSAAAYEQARTALVAECEAAGRITLARFRDLLGVGRKTAQLLLERFDADGVTRRTGDERVLRKRGTIAR